MGIARLVFAVVLFTQCAAAQGSQAELGWPAVWQISTAFQDAAHAACDKLPDRDAFDCLIGQMSRAGAPPAAINFTRELYKQSHGEFGIMTGFQKQSPVALAWVTYPMRANTNYGLMLVNGQPPIINVEDLKLLDRKTMEQSFQFRDLKYQFPKVDVWPGDRDGKIWPTSQTGPGDEIQFVVGYPLLNGCHACEHAGFAIFTWNFDSKGKFLGTSFMGMTPPPLN